MNADRIECRACGQGRELEEFRVFSTEPPLLFDFCVHCERKEGTLTLYRRYSGYGTPEVMRAVYTAQRTPIGRRSAEQVRLLIEPKPAKLILTKEDVVDRELQRRELCRRSLLYFTTTFDPTYTPGWVHQDIARRLEKFMRDIEAGLAPRLMIFMPPRAGKSKLASDMGPSWMLGHHPEWEFIEASHGLDLPVGFSRNIRDRIRDPEYQAIFPDTKVRSDSSAVETWKTTKNGGYLAAGIGVGITGKGFHVGIVDDPIKDFEAAQSETIRANTWNWFQSVFYTRKAPGAGILLIQCMVGSTQVLMADGTEKALADICTGEAIATYTNGKLSTSIVLNWANQGSDRTYAISTSSGRIVKANERHPFLVQRDGVQEWVRLRNLKVSDRLVVIGGSGAALSANTKGVKSPFVSEGIANLTTTKRDGQAVGVHHQPIQFRDELHISSTGTASRSPSTTQKLLSKKDDALSVENYPEKMSARIGAGNFASTIATEPESFVDSCATTAILLSDTEKQSECCSPPLSTYEITLDEIVSIELSSFEDVFDIQVAGTENFIANGVVSHNTRWHDADVAGMLVQLEAQLRRDGTPEEQMDRWEVVSYPAIAEADETLLKDGTIWRGPLPEDAEPLRLLRKKGDALHPERFSLNELLKTKNTVAKAIWQAMYQQNPTPDEGDYFKKADFRYRILDPDWIKMARIFITADYALGKKQRNDYTVVAVYALTAEDDLFVLDVIRGRGWSTGGTGNTSIVFNIVELIKKWKPEIYAGEQGQVHNAVWPLVEKELMKQRIYITVDETLTPITDKPTRARPLQGRMQNGKFYFSYAASKRPDEIEAVEHELLRFPDGVNDDIVDCFAWGARLALNLPLPQTAAPPQRQSWMDKLNSTGVVGETSHMAA